MIHRYRYLLLIFVGVFVYGADLPRAEAKKPYVSQAGKFQVTFPHPPKEHQVIEKTAVGSIGENIYQAKTKKGTYTVEYSILPEIAVFFGGKKTIYDKAKKNFLKKTGSTETSFSDTSVSGHKAKELVFTAANGDLGKVQFILVGRYFYAVVAEGSRGAGPLDAFLKTFSILP